MEICKANGEIGLFVYTFVNTDVMDIPYTRP